MKQEQIDLFKEFPLKIDIKKGDVKNGECLFLIGEIDENDETTGHITYAAGSIMDIAVALCHSMSQNPAIAEAISMAAKVFYHPMALLEMMKLKNKYNESNTETSSKVSA